MVTLHHSLRGKISPLKLLSKHKIFSNFNLLFHAGQDTTHTLVHDISNIIARGPVDSTFFGHQNFVSLLPVALHSAQNFCLAKNLHSVRTRCCEFFNHTLFEKFKLMTILHFVKLVHLNKLSILS